jgi:hypothetical protein
MDAMMPPAGTVLVIVEEVKKALGLMPTGVLLTPKDYQALLDQIEQLKRQLQPAKVETPTSCKLTGQVEGDLVRFQVQYEFRTDRPKALVALGCQRARPKGGTLDDHLAPLVTADDGGLLVQVDKPGDHKLTLEIELALAARGAKGTERGFDLGLPRAAITALEQFVLPGLVPEVRLNPGGRTVAAKPLDPQHTKLEGVTLGAEDRLDLVWKGPDPLPQAGQAELTADGQLAVRLDEKRIITEVRLHLKVLRGEVRQWRVRLPPGATLEETRVTREEGKASPAEDERVERVELPADPNNPVVTVRLKEATAEPLRLFLRVWQPRPAGQVAVGPFVVLDAGHQQGTIVVSAPADLRVWCHAGADVIQQDVTEEQRRDNAVAAFTYWSSPKPAAAGPPPAPPVRLEVEPARGAAELRVAHDLYLTDLGWKAVTKVTVRPVGPGVDHFDLRLPADYPEPDKRAFPAEVVEDVRLIDPGRRVAQFKLFPRRGHAATLSLEALYPPPAAGQQSTVLELPYPVQTAETHDRGGQVTVTLPEGLELYAPAPGNPVPWHAVREHTWRSEPEQAPARVHLAWRPYGPELPVQSGVEVTLAGGRAQVRQRLQFQFLKGPPGRVRLRLAESLAGHVRVEGEGGGLERNFESKGKPATYWAPLRAGPGGKRDAVTLLYAVPLPGPLGAGPAEKARHLTIPLAWPVQATRVQTKVWVWGEPETQPLAAGKEWEELPAEVVPDRDTLPSLVLAGSGPDLPLTLELATPAGTPLAAVVADRILVRTATAPDGRRLYRAWFRLTRLNARRLDLELPLPASEAKPQVFLDGRGIVCHPVDGRGTLVRFKVEPDLYQGRLPVLLEVRYGTPPARRELAIQTVLRPPLPVGTDAGEVVLGQVRWQVGLARAWVPLFEDDGYPAGRNWEWRGGLWAPRWGGPAGDTKQWLGVSAASPGKEGDAVPDEAEPALDCWRSDLGPFRLIQVPEQAWLLACSLLFLVLGLGLGFLPLPRIFFWAVVAVLGLAVVLAGLWWPGVLAAVIYGCEPGAVVLGLIFGLQWLLHRRYRRQVVFLPGFTRLKAGSSLIRGAANNARPAPAPREPSTVDSPPKRGSSASSELRS